MFMVVYHKFVFLHDAHVVSQGGFVLFLLFKAGESPRSSFVLLLREGFQAHTINTQCKSIVLLLMFTSEAGVFQSVQAILVK